MTKEFILREIKRTAEDNGGTPLGRGRFSSDTTLAKRVAEHFESESGFEDVVLLCQQYTPPARSSVVDSKPTGVEMGSRVVDSNATRTLGADPRSP